MSDDKPKATDVTRKEQFEIYDTLKAIIDKFIGGQDNDLRHALAVSALTHYAAQVVGDTACCSYHSLQLWITIGHNVIISEGPEQDIAFLLEDDHDSIPGFDLESLHLPKGKPH